MKKTSIIAIAMMLIVVLSSCVSTTGTQVNRIDARTQTDLSGYWNDTDVRIIADTLVQECVNAPSIVNFIRQYQRPPVVILGSFRNQSDEHLDTSILAKKFEIALVNSGKVDFVASSMEREELRDERENQQEWSNEFSAKALANEVAADFMLIGSVKTIVDSSGADFTRTYFVTAELVNIEKNTKVWLGENSSIKKYIRRDTVRW
ncbi:MAG: penicillin-binding protein activator LpoB [Spirochaetota bacterium]|jgi:uncharacterized protein (TIGR02722 family)|nr:penicillin-binding protein activator LpoB [Spirochaetota bacterium]